jgi:hypothetical protein
MYTPPMTRRVTRFRALEAGIHSRQSMNIDAVVQMKQ